MCGTLKFPSCPFFEFKILKYHHGRSLFLSTRGSLFWSRKVFEGVHSHVMSLLRKSDFGPLSFLFEMYDHVSKSDFGPFLIVRISDFGPGSYFESKLEQNRNFELLKMDQNRFWTHDHKHFFTFRREN